jgi:hypothetical protein
MAAKPATQTTPTDPRDEYLARVVKDRSFVDIGGLWGTTSEKASVAHQAGAKQLAMIDILPLNDPLWEEFHARRRALGVPEVECLSGDIFRLAEGPAPPKFDVVHCSGVLYHLPNPMQFLGLLRGMTREHLVLTSSVTADLVKSVEGTLAVPKGSALFVPALAGREAAIVRAYWRTQVQDGAIGLTRELDRWDPNDYSPWWWLPTVDCLKAMCGAAGFEFVAGAPFWNQNAYALLLKVRG